MKKVLLFLLSFGIVLQGCKSKNDNTIEVGAILPMTGFFSVNGQTCKEGLDLAVKEINASQDLFTFKILYEDNHSQTKDNQMAFKKLRTQNCKLFVGFGGQLVSGIVPETNNQDVILFAHAANNTEFTTLSNRILRLYPTTEMFAEAISDFFEQQTISKAGIVYLQNDAFTKLAEAFRSEFESRGNSIDLFEGYDPTSRDFKNIVNKAANKGIQCIYVAGSGETAALFIHQLFTNPNTESIPVIGEMSLASSANREIIGELKTPVYVIDNPISEDFINSYKIEYNKIPNAYAAYVYANMYMLLEALNHVGLKEDTKDLYDYFRNNTFETTIGNVSFDKKTSEPNLELFIHEMN